MSSVNVKMYGHNATGIHEIVNVLKKEVKAELVSESWRKFNEVSVVLLSFEKYYFRNGSYASLTIMLTEKENMQTADIIGSGGGEGLFNISWGANSNFAEMATEILRRYNFREG